MLLPCPKFRLYLGQIYKETFMKLSKSVKPISYLKAHASEVIRDVTDNQRTLVITHNGEAKVVVQDVRVYEQFQESLAKLKPCCKASKRHVIVSPHFPDAAAFRPNLSASAFSSIARLFTNLIASSMKSCERRFIFTAFLTAGGSCRSFCSFVCCANLFHEI